MASPETTEPYLHRAHIYITRQDGTTAFLGTTLSPPMVVWGNSEPEPTESDEAKRRAWTDFMQRHRGKVTPAPRAPRRKRRESQ